MNNLWTFLLPHPQASKLRTPLQLRTTGDHRMVATSMLCNVYHMDSVNTKERFLCFLCSGIPGNIKMILQCSFVVILWHC